MNIAMTVWQNLLPDGYKRALIAKALRWAGTAAGSAAAAFLLTHQIDAEAAKKLGTDVTEIIMDLGPLALPIIAAIFSKHDATKVDNQIKNVRDTTAQAVAAAARVGDGHAATDVSVAIQRGDIVVVGQPSQAKPEREAAITAALNMAQVPGGNVSSFAPLSRGTI